MAQGRSLPLVRDAETEHLLKDYATPIFKAAGISNSEPEIILVNDKSFNAFVPDSRRMFINIGVIMDGPIGTIGNDPDRICCKAMTAQCLACADGVSPADSCPNGCSGRGFCRAAGCVCEAGFGGADCGIACSPERWSGCAWV